MSSTNVHSVDETENNPCCSGGQTIPRDDGKIIFPPEKVKQGTSTIEVKMGEYIEIPTQEGSLNKNGIVKNKNGQPVFTLGTEAFTELDSKRQKKDHKEAKDSR